MLKLAMLLNNPGEPAPETQYRDPKSLVDLGYNSLVVWETTSISGVEAVEHVGSGEMRRWVESQFELAKTKVQQAQKAGLDVYITYDVLTLAKERVMEDQAAVLCRNRNNALCPGSDLALEHSAKALEALIQYLPPIQGVVLRFGDTDARRYPYLIGNDILSPHCPRCAHLGRADRISEVVETFYNLVVEKLSRRLIVRAWNVRPNGMHDTPELAQRIADRLPGKPEDDRLVLSFKFTETDFWRYQAWNPASLVCNGRPIIYELQCQREFEGKGGIPNYQVPLWRNGYPERAEQSEIHGLAEAADKVNLVGLWSWVRGGGWGGPFITNESWIDANVYAVPRLADNPSADPRQLAEDWVKDRLKIKQQPIIDAIVGALEASPNFVAEAFYIGAFANTRVNAWHPNMDFVQDDLINARAAWTMIKRLPESELDAVVEEKASAAEHLASARASLQQASGVNKTSEGEALINTMIYAESLFEALRDFTHALVSYRRWQKSKDKAVADQCHARILAAQAHWQHHTQRHANLKGVATAFREEHFWELTQNMLNDVG